MEWWYSIVIGIVLYVYMMTFNRVTRIYNESERTIGWSDFFTTILPVTN